MCRYPNDRFSSRLQQLVESSYVLQGGIYIASNQSNSSRAWDCRVAVDAIGRCFGSLLLKTDFNFLLGLVTSNTCGV